MPKTKVTPRAKHPNKTKQFLDATQNALEMFDDEISSFTDEVKEKAYKHYVRSYREALVPVWNLARFANIDTVLKTVTDKKMQEIKTMAERLKTTPPRPKAISDKTSIPDLKTVTSTMLQQFPDEKLPTASTCEKIGNVFASLSTARTAYSEAAQGLAQLATLLTPEQYTLVLAATVTPCIQLIVPGQHISPLSTPPPPQQESQTAMGRAEIINFTKGKVLPNPEASSLTDCNDNSATHVLAAAVYCQLERNIHKKASIFIFQFISFITRHEVAALFRCNTSQLSKAIMGVEYKSGPHHYKPQKATKRTMETAEQQTGPSKRKALPSTSTQTESTQAPDPDVQDDTLSSSSDSDLPLGLPN